MGGFRGRGGKGEERAVGVGGHEESASTKRAKNTPMNTHTYTQRHSATMIVSFFSFGCFKIRIDRQLSPASV